MVESDQPLATEQVSGEIQKTASEEAVEAAALMAQALSQYRSAFVKADKARRQLYAIEKDPSKWNQLTDDEKERVRRALSAGGALGNIL